MPICQKCLKSFPNRIYVDGKLKIINKRKYCLDCSPFNQHNTSKIHINFKTEKFCTSCNKTLPSTDFHVRRNGNDLSSYCKKCTTIQTTKRKRNLKEQAIIYKGGKCVKCGYDKCQAALQFHYLNKDEKEFSLSHCALTSFEKVKKELDKCILLCANCHAEIHFQN